MPEHQRVRRRPAWFSGASYSNRPHGQHLPLRSPDPFHHSRDGRFHGNAGLVMDGGVGTVAPNGTYSKKLTGTVVDHLGFFSLIPISVYKPLASRISTIFPLKACPNGPELNEKSLGRSVEYWTTTNHSSLPSLTTTSLGQNKSCSLAYCVDTLDSKLEFEKPMNIDQIIPQSQSIETSTKEHNTSPSQRQFLVAVRQFAIRLFLVTFVGIILVCIALNESNQLQASSDLENANERGLPRVESPPLTRKEEEIAKHNGKDMIEDDELSLEEMGGLQKLREEFGEWMKHHRREYHSEDEKEIRFQIWQSNHRR